VAWYRSLYAPRTGGAYDSHHRTAGIAGRARRRGGGEEAGPPRLAEISVEDARGAGALLNASRSARVLNKMTKQEAKDVGIDEALAWRHFRVDNGKASMIEGIGPRTGSGSRGLLSSKG
jgi:hypothetical protein